MKYKMIFLFSTLLLFFSCEMTNGDQQIENVVQSTRQKDFNQENHQKKYIALKEYISKSQNMLTISRMNQEAKEKEAKSFISTALIDSIFPYWIGTKWDFNGITPEPRKGEIACGYFVSTTLQHVGIKLNRYKTAQKAASDIVKQLCEPTTIKTLGSLEKLQEYLTDIDNNNILIVGLDFHVGFIFKKNNTPYFAHSNYIEREGVIIEPLETSSAIKASKAYVIGNVSLNDELISKWVN